MNLELEWKNIWFSPEWLPMKASTKDSADRELMKRMPYTEDGTQIRRVDTGDVINWEPVNN